MTIKTKYLKSKRARWLLRDDHLAFTYAIQSNPQNNKTKRLFGKRNINSNKMPIM